MTTTCPNDLQPCTAGCHNSHDCARWGPYSCMPHHHDVEIPIDTQAQAYVEGRDHAYTESYFGS